jgi:hypothetical protein
VAEGAVVATVLAAVDGLESFFLQPVSNAPRIKRHVMPTAGLMKETLRDVSIEQEPTV